MSELSEFLESIGLARLGPTFEEEELTLEDLADLTDTEFGGLKVRLGQRKKIQRELARRGVTTSFPSELSPRTPDPAASAISDQATALPGSRPPEPAAAAQLARWPMESAPASGADAPLTEGLELGRFRLVRLLGEGGFARVWQAHDSELGEDIALKIVRTGLVNASVAVRTFGQEFANRAKIADPTHVLRVEKPRREEHASRSLVVMPMELADGGTLRDWLDARCTKPRKEWIGDALDLFEQACRGTEAIHAGGLVHLDLKPENLLLVGDTLKVADLGLSRDLGQLSAVASVLMADGVGSPMYMAPEQVMAARPDDVEASADVWALGVILFELLDGKPPFGGRSPELVRRKIADPTMRINFRRVPEEYLELFRAVLCRDETKRLESASRLREKVVRVRELIAREVVSELPSPLPTDGPGLEAELKRLEATLRASPDDKAVADRAVEVHRRLAALYYAELEPLDQVLFLRATDASILELSLDPIGGFLISQVDGEITVEEILTILSTFDRFRVLSSLHFFLENGILELRT